MMKIYLIRNNLLLLIIFFIQSCDFTPRLNKEILKAQEYIREQEYDKATAQYERILDRSLPNDIKVKIYYQLGELYSIHMNQYKRAILFLDKIQEISEDLIWVVKAEEKMAEIHFTYLKNFQKASFHYERLTNFRPKLDKNDFFEYRLALSMMNDDELKKSYDLFEKITKNSRHEYNTRSFFYMGLIKFKEKKWDESIASWRIYLKVEKNRSNIVQTVFLMANAYETNEELKKAYNLYYSILAEYPNSSVLKNRLNSIYNRRIARKR